jgi:hypothetical protein
MTTLKTVRIGKDALALAVFALLVALLGAALVKASLAPMITVLGLAFAVPAMSSAAVRLYRDLTGDHFKA